MDLEAIDSSDIHAEPSASSASSSPSGSLLGVLDKVDEWISRFVLTTTAEDIHLMTLWAAHTYVVEQTYTTPRLQIDSVMPESGKTTALEHLQHLVRRPLSASTISSEALLPRVLERGIRTILIDEADRSLDPKNPIMAGVMATINTGYKRGGSRPVLVKDSEGNWTDREMSTFAPVALAGNNPSLPDDTRTRCIRVLLMPDFEGLVESSDWEDIEEDADHLRIDLEMAMEAARESVGNARPTLPEDCKGRMREKWRPLARVAQAAGGRWPGIINTLIHRDMEERKMERAEGLQNLPLRVHLIRDIAQVWQAGDQFMPSTELVDLLAARFPTRWGLQSTKGLTVQGMGRMLMQGYKISSDREPSGARRRGYSHLQFTESWRRFQVEPPHIKPDGPDEQAQLDETRNR
ncbi:DUF3631 domain-containing protein [Citricoccus parietis]|uniref:DUF3631 domain-containing protein n=2 Tax=Citricoccus parietis TaxID=592307 RepID=A0ABV6F5Q2_9MICC